MVGNDLDFDKDFIETLTSQMWPVLKASIKTRL